MAAPRTPLRSLRGRSTRAGHDDAHHGRDRRVVREDGNSDHVGVVRQSIQALPYFVSVFRLLARRLIQDGSYLSFLDWRLGQGHISYDC